MKRRSPPPFSPPANREWQYAEPPPLPPPSLLVSLSPIIPVRTAGGLLSDLWALDYAAAAWVEITPDPDVEGDRPAPRVEPPAVGPPRRDRRDRRPLSRFLSPFVSSGGKAQARPQTCDLSPSHPARPPRLRRPRLRRPPGVARRKHGVAGVWEALPTEPTFIDGKERNVSVAARFFGNVQHEFHKRIDSKR